MYRNAFKRSRCIIPASGYCEWRAEGGAKQPYYFSAAEGGVLSISGLWDDGATGTALGASSPAR
jgi:putative SOS response-associated peptidase YedK